MRRALVAVALFALFGCTERVQTTSADKGSAPAWQGAADPYTAQGWKAGDEASWKAQLQRRTQAQNEYVRIGN